MIVLLVAGALLLAGLIAIPVLLALGLVAIFLYVLAQILMIPLKLIGWTVGAGAGLVVFLVKAALIMFLLVVSFVLTLALALPLLPLALLVLGLWLVFSRPRGRRQATI